MIKHHGSVAFFHYSIPSWTSDKFVIFLSFVLLVFHFFPNTSPREEERTADFKFCEFQAFWILPLSLSRLRHTSTVPIQNDTNFTYISLHIYIYVRSFDENSMRNAIKEIKWMSHSRYLCHITDIWRGIWAENCLKIYQLVFMQMLKSWQSAFEGRILKRLMKMITLMRFSRTQSMFKKCLKTSKDLYISCWKEFPWIGNQN